MTSSTKLRRRLHHGDVDGKRREHYDSSDFGCLGEPLLGNDRHQEQYSLEELLDDPGRKVNLHWSFIFSQLLAQWAQWLGGRWGSTASRIGLRKAEWVDGEQEVADGEHSGGELGTFWRLGFLEFKISIPSIIFGRANIVLGSRSLLGRLVSPPSTSQRPFLAPALTSLQEERLKHLKSRLKVPFDGSRTEHQDALKQLWRLAFPTRELPPLKSELWKEMGWQGTDPATDFRGGGFISLQNLIYFAEKYPDSFQSLLHKQDGQRAEWEYPFAVAGINISFMLAQMLDLQSEKPTSRAGARFLELLAEDEMAFDMLFCVAFQMMDAQWLAKRASYMEFNDVLKSTRTQLERELELEDTCSVKDLPAYNLLRG